MSDRYFVVSLGNSTYEISQYDGTLILTMRGSRAQADAVAKALAQAYDSGKNSAGSFQDGFEHGYAVGYRESREEAFEEGYAASQAEGELSVTKALDGARDALLDRSCS